MVNIVGFVAVLCLSTLITTPRQHCTDNRQVSGLGCAPRKLFTGTGKGPYLPHPWINHERRGHEGQEGGEGNPQDSGKGKPQGSLCGWSVQPSTKSHWSVPEETRQARWQLQHKRKDRISQYCAPRSSAVYNIYKFITVGALNISPAQITIQLLGR